MTYDRRRAGRALLVVAVVLIIVLLLLLPPTQDLFRKYLLDPLSPHYPEEVEMELRRTLTLDPNGGEITQFELDIVRPMNLYANGTEIQKVVSLDASPRWDELEQDEYTTMVWREDEPAGETSVVLTYSLRQSIHKWELDESSVLDKGEVPTELRDRYLVDEWKITTSDPTVRALSDELVGDEDNVYAIARTIYDWMVENIDYPNTIVSGEPRSALETYRDRVGDCDDQSILFCALARAAGVPAWLQLGALYDRSSGSMGGHGWVQMYMPTGDGGTNVTIDIVNRDFLVWMPNLFCEFTDNGDADVLYDYYHPIVYYAYPGAQAPVFSDTWEVLVYEESEETVTLRFQLIARTEDQTFL